MLRFNHINFCNSCIGYNTINVSVHKIIIPTYKRRKLPGNLQISLSFVMFNTNNYCIFYFSYPRCKRGDLSSYWVYTNFVSATKFSKLLHESSKEHAESNNIPLPPTL